jgi:hypothetical protein
LLVGLVLENSVKEVEKRVEEVGWVC